MSMIKFSRYPILAVLVLVALFCLEISSTIQDVVLAQDESECTVTVQPGESIQATIDEAEEGAVICLAEGTWEENVKITKSLNLRGQGPEVSVIRASEHGQPVVRISTPNGATPTDVVVGELRLTGAAAVSLLSLWSRGVLVQDSARATISECTVSVHGTGIFLSGSARATITGGAVSTSGVGIQLRDSSEAMISKCTVSAEDQGILFADSAQATISECTVSAGFAGYGTAIRLEDSSQATVSGSTISGHLGHGIAVEGSAQATISGNLISENRLYGIVSFSTGEVRGQENKMCDNGVDLGGDLPGTLRKSLVEPTEKEIVYPDDRYPTVQHAVDALTKGGRLILREGEYTAGVTITKELEMVAEEGAEVPLRANNIEMPVLSLVGGAKLSAAGLNVTDGNIGFLLGADAQATISGCTVLGTWNDGIRLMDSSQATIGTCTVSENRGDGIRLMDSSQATISTCTVSENAGPSISLQGSARAMISGSNFSESGVGIGVVLSGSSQATISESTVSANWMNGIWVRDSSQVTITGCAISRSGTDIGVGIHLEDLSQGTFIECTVSGHGIAGIRLEDAAQVTVTESDISSDEYGMLLGGSSQATISGCTLSENDRDGISLGNSARVTISGSTFSGNGEDGISMMDSSQAEIRDNEIFDNQGYGVALYQRPCFDTDSKFTGKVEGGVNAIHDNDNGDVCPDDLKFLMTEEGGELNRRQQEK